MTKLNLGAGRKPKEGWINLDIAPLPNIDVVHDLSKFPYPFPDNEFDEINSYGVIELVNTELKTIMEELWRISKPDGIIHIICPCFPSACSSWDILTKHFITYNFPEYFTGEGYDYYSNARFDIISRKFIYSENKFLRWLNPIVNLFPRFHQKFGLFGTMSNKLEFFLRVKK